MIIRKSEGNFFTVREIGEQYSLQVLRFFMLSAHYRSPLNFSRELMEASKNGLDRILTAVDNLKFLSQSAVRKDITEKEQEYLDDISELRNKFDGAMEDDFNTADAISAIFEIVKAANSNVTSDNSLTVIETTLEYITKLCDVLGIITSKEEELLDDDIEELINDRQNARKNKDFKKADEIRNLLLEKGIILEDTREGVKWKRA